MGEFAVENLEYAVGVLGPSEGRGVTMMPVFPRDLTSRRRSSTTLPTEGGVQRGGRLVDQHQVRVIHQGASDGYPLPLATGELLGEVLARSARPSSSRSWSARACARLCASHAPDQRRDVEQSSPEPSRKGTRLADWNTNPTRRPGIL